MSSGGYETGLSVDRTARRLLLAAIAVAALTGASLLLAAAPAGIALKALLALAWLLECAREARRFCLGMSRLDRIQIGADGRLRGVREGGRLRLLELLPGSIVAGRWAWLRLRFGDGLRYGELLRERPESRDAWRRLCVIWLHRGAFLATPLEADTIRAPRRSRPGQRKRPADGRNGVTISSKPRRCPTQSPENLS